MELAKPLSPVGLSALLVEALLASPEEKHGGGLQDGGEIRTPFLSAAGLSSAMEAHSVDVRQCYEAMLNNKPSQLGGRVLLSFVITPAGAVDNPSVDQKRSTLHDLGLAACLLKVLETVTSPTHLMPAAPRLSTPSPFNCPETALRGQYSSLDRMAVPLPSTRRQLVPRASRVPSSSVAPSPSRVKRRTVIS